MSSKKLIGFVSSSALIGALAYGCSSSSTTNPATGDDGGGSHDASVGDAVSDSAKLDSKAEAALTCAPADVSAFTPPAFVPVKRVVGACSSSDITAFTTACLDQAHTKAQCDAYKMAHAACAGCLETSSTAAGWGAGVFHASKAPGSTLGVIYANVGGCFEILGGADGLDCSKKSQIAEACEEAACDASCQITDDASFQLYEACVTQAAMNGCSAQATARGACFQALSGVDGGASICTTGADFQTSFDIIAPIVCGGGSSDAGPG